MKKILKWLDEYFEISVSVVLMLVMTAVIFVQVIMRYIFSNSLSWSEELARYIFIWIIYLSISFGAKRLSHIKIESALLLFPKKLRPYIVCLGDLIVFAFCIHVVYTGWGNMILQNRSKSAALGIPMSMIYAAPVVGFFLTAIREVQVMLNRVRELRKGEE